MVVPVTSGIDIEIPVLTVSAGPAGLTSALAPCSLWRTSDYPHTASITTHTPDAHTASQCAVQTFRRTRNQHSVS
jgi:hypothetical protein